MKIFYGHKKRIKSSSFPIFSSLGFFFLLYSVFYFLAWVQEDSGLYRAVPKLFFDGKKVFPTYEELSLSSLLSLEANPVPGNGAENTVKKSLATNYILNKEHLSDFTKKMNLLEKGKIDHVHILHWGDSIIWGDWASARLKNRFQKDFGDGGRGIIPIMPAPAEKLRNHNSRSGGFLKYYIPFESFTMPEDKRLGFLGYSYLPSSSNAYLESEYNQADWQTVRILFRNDKTSPMQSGFYYSVNGGKSKTIPLTIPSRECFVHTSNLKDNYASNAKLNKVKIWPMGKAGNIPNWDMVSLYNRRGVVYSTVVQMGLHQAWNLMIPEKNLECGLSASGVDLILFHFGVNESASMHRNYKGFTEAKYRTQLDLWYGRIKRHRKNTAILVVGPYERLEKSGGALAPHSSHEKVIRIQKEMALKHGFAYLDTYSLLGGAGHARRMVGKKQILSDYIHLTPDGSLYLADLIYDTIQRELFSQKFSGGKTVIPEKNSGTMGKKTAIQFNSIRYFIFFFFVIYVSLFLLRWPYARLLFLLGASWYFYASWMLWPLSLIIISSVIDYYASLGIFKERDRNKSGKIYLIFSLVSNLGLLAFFKYLGFFTRLANEALAFMGTGKSLPVLDVLLPVGISFYTFQTLSYTIDVYRGKMQVEKSFWKFSLYVAFFPQLVAGPIVRAGHFIPALKDKIYHFVANHRLFYYGVFFILLGLVKKTSADWMGANLVDRVFDSPGMYTGWETLAAFYGYGLQIYGDFSGYSDIAIGSAMILGFHLTLNFNRPYSALSISDFWRRWHISLGSWIRDYLYISLGGNRKQVYLNLAITMFLAGLWHGAGLQFILWGMYLGFFLMLERSLGISKIRAFEINPWKKTMMIFITLHLILFSWIIFRSSSWDQFTSILANLNWDNLFGKGLHASNINAGILGMLVFFYVYQLTPRRWKTYLREIFVHLPFHHRLAITVGVLVFLYSIQTSAVAPFIYFQF